MFIGRKHCSTHDVHWDGDDGCPGGSVAHVVRLSPEEALAVLGDIAVAVERRMDVRLRVVDGDVRMRIGYGAWSSRIGTVEAGD